MTTMTRRITLWLGLSLAVFWSAGAAAAAPITALYFTSTPLSFVGQGQTVNTSLSPSFVFTPSAQANNGVEVFVANFGGSPPPPGTQPLFWILFLQAGDRSPLSVGHYADATRYPFNAAGVPGLDFSGNGRGNNQSTGFFDVLDVL